jgi:L-alanine-DL-glutamate epimerase-like enolase superfamily enzyme
VSSALIEQVIVRQVGLQLTVPYKVSLLTMHEFDPFLVEVRDSEGRSGFGEAMIVLGYTSETVEGSWRVCCELAKAIAGRSAPEAMAIARRAIPQGVGAASAVLAALDMVMNHAVLAPTRDLVVPLLAPLNADEPAELAHEIEQKIAQGFRTLKVKVGFDWRADLQRVQAIQELAGERATLRLDANQGYDSSEGVEFARRLDPKGIELFEQPCHMDDWKANAAVAQVSTVPVMLDESIYDVTDIDRAAAISGVGFVKLKLKKIGSVDMLLDGLERIRRHGMTPVLGNGVSLEVGCWGEACVAAHAIDNAGEMNGFLKAGIRLFENPLPFSGGAIRIPAGYMPRLDHNVLRSCTRRELGFTGNRITA